MTVLAALLWLAVVPAGAQDSRETAAPPKPPAVGLSIDDDAAKMTVRPSLLSGTFELTPIFSAGMLAPFGVQASYPTLTASPFGLLGLRAGVTGSVEALVVGTYARLGMSSRSPFGPEATRAESPANALRGQDRFEQQLAVSSLHTDVGKTFSVSAAWKAAVFAASDAWLVGPSHGASDGMLTQGGVTASTGLIAMRKSGVHELTLSGQVQGEAARRTMWRNGEYAAIPSGSVGAEYARADGPRRASVGLEASTSRADAALRPYIGWSDKSLALTVAADLRRSNDPFYPDRKVLGAEVSYALTPSVSLQLSGHAGQERYPMAPEPTTVYRVMAAVAVDLGRRVEARVAKAVEHDGARRAWDASRDDAMNARTPSAADHDAFRKALAEAPTLDEFVARAPAGSADRILAAVSIFGRSISDFNYNVDESKEHPNENDAREFYARVRSSALTGSKDPVTVCIGAAQFEALLARALAAKNGVPLEASAIDVRVPTAGGLGGGHAVAAIKTREYGIVLADWGKLTPTYTWDTQEAMRIYQALQGMPAIYHAVTAGPDGRVTGNLFTEEGKLFLRQLTAYGEVPQPMLERIFRDAPAAGPRAVERYRELLRALP